MEETCISLGWCSTIEERKMQVDSELKKIHVENQLPLGKLKKFPDI